MEGINWEVAYRRDGQHHAHGEQRLLRVGPERRHVHRLAAGCRRRAGDDTNLRKRWAAHGGGGRALGHPHPARTNILEVI